MQIISIKELRAKLGVNQKTLKTWLEDVPELRIKNRQRILNPHQTNLVLKHFNMLESK